MNVDPFAPPAAGDVSPFVTSLNTIGNALEVLRNTTSPRGQLRASGDETDHRLPTPHASVLVRNDTGAALPALSVLKLGATLQNVATQPHDVMRLPSFAGTTPAAQSDNFAILREGAGDGKISEGVIRGAAVCYVNVTNTAHKWATPDPGSTAQLLSGETGPARILTVPTGTGRQLCAVLIDDRGDRLVRVEVDETPIDGGGGGGAEPATTFRIYAADEPDADTPFLQFTVAENYSGGFPGAAIAVYPLGENGDVAYVQQFVTDGSETTSIVETRTVNNETANVTYTASGGVLLATFGSNQTLNASSATTVGFTGARTEGTLAAAGSVQGDAAAIVTDAVGVSGADGTKGVLLPNTTGGIIVVENQTAFTLMVYPNSGASISTGGTNAAYSQLGSEKRVYWRVSSTKWYTSLLS